MRRLLLFTVAVALAPGCQKSTGSDKGGEAPEQPGLPGQSAQDLDAPLAKIDDVVITVREFQERINRQSPYIRARYTSRERKLEFLDNLIRFEVLAKEAQARKFDQHPDVVRTMKQVMIQKLMKDEFEKRIKLEDISEADLRAYYQANAHEFNKPEEVRVSAIIVRNRSVAAKAAKEALGEQGQTHKGFRELVNKYSVDEHTKLRGGDLRYFARDTSEYPRPVVEAAFGLAQTGDVAGPIDGGDGTFYILKRTGLRKEVQRSFDQVKRQLQNRVYRERRTSAQENFVTELRAKSKIEVFEQNLGKIRVDTSTSSVEPGDGHHGEIPGFPAEVPGSSMEKPPRIPVEALEQPPAAE